MTQAVSYQKFYLLQIHFSHTQSWEKKDTPAPPPPTPALIRESGTFYKRLQVHKVFLSRSCKFQVLAMWIVRHASFVIGLQRGWGNAPNGLSSRVSPGLPNFPTISTRLCVLPTSLLHTQIPNSWLCREIIMLAFCLRENNSTTQAQTSCNACL